MGEKCFLGLITHFIPNSVQMDCKSEREQCFWLFGKTQNYDFKMSKASVTIPSCKIKDLKRSTYQIIHFNNSITNSLLENLLSSSRMKEEICNITFLRDFRLKINLKTFNGGQEGGKATVLERAGHKKALNKASKYIQSCPLSQFSVAVESIFKNILPSKGHF